MVSLPEPVKTIIHITGLLFIPLNNAYKYRKEKMFIKQEKTEE